MFWADFVHYTHFARLTKRVLVLTQIFLRHLIDVGVGPLLGDLHHFAANFEIPVRIVGINNCHGYARVSADVTVLLAALGGVEYYMLTIAVHPDRGGLRASVGHDRGQAGKSLLVEQIAELLGDDIRHIVFPPMPTPTQENYRRPTSR